MKNNREGHEFPCIHRKYWPDHKSCFLKGRIKYPKGMFKEEIETRTWYEFSNKRVGYLDLESSGLKADFSTMLTWCIKERDGKIHYDVVNKQELFDGLFDERIIRSCIDEMSKYDIICTYYGKGFDLPFLRSKAFHYDIPFPGFSTEFSTTRQGKDIVRTTSEITHFDLYFVVKSKFNLGRKSLDSVCDYLHIKGKTNLDKEIWRRGAYGDPVALREILSHNRGDVEILEQLHKKIENQAKWIKSPL